MKKYTYNPEADEHLNKIYTTHKARTIKEKIQALETLPQYCNGYEGSFPRGGIHHLRAMEYSYLIDLNLLRL